MIGDVFDKGVNVKSSDKKAKGVLREMQLPVLQTQTLSCSYDLNFGLTQVLLPTEADELSSKNLYTIRLTLLV